MPRGPARAGAGRFGRCHAFAKLPVTSAWLRRGRSPRTLGAHLRRQLRAGAGDDGRDDPRAVHSIRPAV